MMRRHLPTRGRRLSSVTVALVATAFALAPRQVTATQPSVCSDLSGAAFGLCNAYCNAQGCSLDPSQSCLQLRKDFQKNTGSSVFPCDCHDLCVTGPPLSPTCDSCAAAVCSSNPACCTTSWSVACVAAADLLCGACPACGNGVTDPGEACDPPGGVCSTEAGGPGTCSADCGACVPLAPVCGNGLEEQGEQCDPPGSPCAGGGVCQAGCSCAAPAIGFCIPTCADTCTGTTGCLQGCDGGTANCACVATAEQTAACVLALCTLVPCSSSAECGPGAVCFTEGCCGG
jgi:hypothetical protein